MKPDVRKSEISQPQPALEPRHGLRHEAIRDELDRILASVEFQATDRVRNLLRFVVEETLAGRADLLKGFTIATAVFERGDDFDSAHDPVVRIQAGRLRSALERYYLVAGGNDPIVIDMPKGRYVPRFHRRKSGEGTDRLSSATSDRPDHPAGPAVAVLPLESLAAAVDRPFFTVGLAEELVTELHRYQDLTVIPCHRALASAGPTLDVEECCRKIGARFLLGGSVRCDEESVKVSVHLVDAVGRQIWARSFKHDLEAARLIQTQEEIARCVVAAVAGEQGIIAQRLAAESRKKSPVELSTYEAMLRYYTHQINPSPETGRACFEALRAAAEREPEFGPVWSALASLYCQMYVFDVAGFDDALETGLNHARRGVALEPGRQLSRLVLAHASLVADDLDAYRDEAATALALNPANPYAMDSVGYLDVLAGDFERGRSLLDRSLSVNPFHPSFFHDGCFVEHYWRKDYQGALDAVAVDREKNFWISVMLAAAFGKLDRLDEAASAVETVIALKPDFPARARELIRRSAKVEAFIEDLVDGLRRAGMAVVDN